MLQLTSVMVTILFIFGFVFNNMEYTRLSIILAMFILIIDSVKEVILYIINIIHLEQKKKEAGNTHVEID